MKDRFPISRKSRFFQKEAAPFQKATTRPPRLFKNLRGRVVALSKGAASFWKKLDFLEIGNRSFMKKFVNLLFKIAIGSCWPLFLPLKEEHEGASYDPWCPGAGYMYIYMYSMI